MNKMKLAVVLALAGTGFYAQSASAFTYDSQNGDILIGFRSTSGSITTDYLIDVGHTLFADAAAAPGQTLTIGNFGADLARFDANWFTDGTTRWGVIADAQAADADGSTLYAGISETAANHPFTSASLPTSYRPVTSNTQSGIISSYDTVGGNAQNGGAVVAPGNSSVVGGGSYVPAAQVQLQNAGNSASYFSVQNPSSGVSFGQFTSTAFEGAVGTTYGNNLDFIQINPSDSTAATPGSFYKGTFSIDSTGTITYGPTSAVPEPSTFAALAGGLSLLGFIRRRRA